MSGGNGYMGTFGYDPPAKTFLFKKLYVNFNFNGDNFSVNTVKVKMHVMNSYFKLFRGKKLD